MKIAPDPQEAALGKVTRIADPAWGQETAANWGTLAVDVDGGIVTRPVESVPGDYRHYYAGVRDALLGKAASPVPTLAAWQVARLMEWARESSEQRREIACDWSESLNRRIVQCGRSFLRAGRFLFDQRDPETEAGSLPWNAGSLDAAAVRRENGASNGKAHS